MRRLLVVFGTAGVAGCLLVSDLDGLAGPADVPDAAPDAPAQPSTDPVGLGDGKHGSRTISGPEVLNEYATLDEDAPSGATKLRVGPDVAFAAGDAVLVWQTTGATAATSGDPNPVSLVDVGQYEMARVEAAVPGEITLRSGIVASYRATGGQVVRVPELDDLTIGSSGIVTALPWDGRRGGIVALVVRGTLRNDGVLRVDGMGFRGGRTYRNAGKQNCLDLDGLPVDGYAAKGESFYLPGFSPQNENGNAAGGRGNFLSGGGGGNCHNAGGAGGGNGGRGGNGGNTSGTSTGLGGLGGSAVQGSLLDRLTLGGGGGAGDQNNGVGATNGGSGGGAVVVRARRLEGVGVVSANGDGLPSSSEDGGSGGGAGGSVVLRVVEDAKCTVQARGGNGGGASHATVVLGPGGGGAGGRVFVQGTTVECPIDAVSGIAGRQPNGSDPHAGAGPTTNEPGFVESQPGGYVP